MESSFIAYEFCSKVVFVQDEMSSGRGFSADSLLYMKTDAVLT